MGGKITFAGEADKKNAAELVVSLEHAKPEERPPLLRALSDRIVHLRERMDYPALVNVFKRLEPSKDTQTAITYAKAIKAASGLVEDQTEVQTDLATRLSVLAQNRQAHMIEKIREVVEDNANLTPCFTLIDNSYVFVPIAAEHAKPAGTLLIPKNRIGAAAAQFETGPTIDAYDFPKFGGPLKGRILAALGEFTRNDQVPGASQASAATFKASLMAAMSENILGKAARGDTTPPNAGVVTIRPKARRNDTEFPHEVYIVEDDPKP